MKYKFDPDKYLEQKEKDKVFDPDAYLDSKLPKMGLGEATVVSGRNALMFGGAPLVSGIGGALGEAAAEASNPTEESILKRLSNIPGALKKGFNESRLETKAEQAKADRDQPIGSLVGTLGAGLLTAPLTPITSLKSALALGGAQGALRAAGESESLGEAANLAGQGLLSGGIGFGAGKAAAKGAGLVTKGVEAAGKGAKKLSSALTGLTEKEIETYATRGPEVKKLIAQYGDDVEGAADKIREEFASKIQATKSKVYQDMKSVFEKPANQAKTVDLTKTLEKLENKLGSMSEVNKKLRGGEVSELEEMIKSIKSVSDNPSAVPLTAANEIKQFLQDSAKSSYLKGGQIFQRGGLAQQAAKEAANSARTVINEVAPDLAKANKTLFDLHRIEENINKNLIAAGKPEAGLLAAGRGANNRNTIALQKLGKITDSDFLQKAEDLAAAKTFANPSILPQDTTGKSVARIGLGTALGALGGGAAGAGVGAALTSPMALKLAIDAGRFPAALVQKLGGPEAMIKMLDNPKSKAALITLLSQGE